MKYYKIVFGYEAENYIQIDESELEKAVYVHLTGKNAVFTGGSVSGTRIVAIQPDYHRAMGWNRGYRLEADDYAQLSKKGIARAMQHMLERTQARVQYLIANNKTELIGKNVDIPQLAIPNTQLPNTTALADKMRIKS